MVRRSRRDVSRQRAMANTRRRARAIAGRPTIGMPVPRPSDTGTGLRPKRKRPVPRPSDTGTGLRRPKLPAPKISGDGRGMPNPKSPKVRRRLTALTSTTSPDRRTPKPRTGGGMKLPTRRTRRTSPRRPTGLARLARARRR